MKSLLSPLLCAAGFALVVLTSGCDTANVRQARQTQTITMLPDRAMPDVAMEVVNDLRLVLPAPDPATGLAWVIVSNNRKVLDQTSGIKLVAPVPPDVTGTAVITFYAIKPGKSVIRFVLVHPEEKEAVPVSKCAVLVRVSD